MCPRFAKCPKPKLPRKRKKACIAAQGRKSYRDVVQLAKVEGEIPCKFWVNSKLKHTPVMYYGRPVMVMQPTEYW